MKSKLRNAIVASARICAVVAVFVSARAARADDGLRVVVVVDLTTAGKAVAKPTPGQPAYYAMVPAGDKNIGDVVTNYQDRPPPSAPEVEQMLARSLAEQGYLPATRRTPPSLILICSWGYIAPRLVHMGKGPAMIVDEEEVVPTVAGNSREVQIMDHPPVWVDELIHAERMQRYYLTVTAFDYLAWRSHQVVPLWKAHVSVPLWGHYLYEVMPTLVAAGAPAFGQQTVRPQVFTTETVPAGRVVVGIPTVKAYPDTPSH